MLLDFLFPAGDGGKGWALVSTKAEYDREKTKYYLMQIVMWDMRGHKDAHLFSMSGTNTLTIEIGDENDNKHGPGHKEIFIYNYKGVLSGHSPGYVYAGYILMRMLCVYTYPFINQEQIMKRGKKCFSDFLELKKIIFVK